MIPWGQRDVEVRTPLARRKFKKGYEGEMGQRRRMAWLSPQATSKYCKWRTK